MSQPLVPIQRQEQTQTMEDYATEDAKTMVVEKIQCTNQFKPKRWRHIVEHDGMDPMTLASTYFESDEIIDILHKVHNDHRLKRFCVPARMRHMSRYQEQVSEENYLEAKLRQSKQGFMTRQVTGPAIRAASTSSAAGDVQAKKWYRKLI